ncbi:hypothetical protein [Burkholderia ambifaria]|uniref:hypothetical protein n=1 Tax=Burkholderia ambifaria TaxID=152480 RepID=UPI00158A0FF8|nr:hypothetical protein [Burkholderia ambifaria]
MQIAARYIGSTVALRCDPGRKRETVFAFNDRPSSDPACASALVCVFHVCAVRVSFGATRWRCDGVALAAAGSSRLRQWPRSALATRFVDPRAGALNRIFVKMRVAREGRREAFEGAVLLFCLIGTYVTVAARGQADYLSATTSIEGSTRRHAMT